MKAKLVKTENGYGLEDVEIIAFYSSKRLDHKHYKLSKQNCDEIFGVVDVDDMMKDILSNCEKTKEGYILGFKVAMELNKDKVFTLEDIEEAFAYGQLNQVHNQKYFSGSKTYIQSLQQPTEIEVEIVMDTINDGLDEMAQPQYAKVPKLDENGCLILKKI
jgi:hypothetical protein